jgi:Fic family protein
VISLAEATNAELVGLDQALAGTPYTIEGGGSAELEHVVGMRLRSFSARAASLGSRYASESLHPLRTTHRVQEVYESNAIEGLGLGLAETDQTMRRNSGLSMLDITRFTVAHSLVSDSHVYDVVGLQYARQLADTIAESKTRPITESDLRSLHKLILGAVSGAGTYKRYVNSISGSEHQPPPPTDTPSHMQRFTAWLSNPDVHPLVQATVAHAWLTHIHPFEDGNGRMARLVANMTLARAGYPPIIVKASAHKQAYLEALADSDRGGDLLPLLGVFSNLMKATFRQVERPTAAITTWRRMLESRQPSAFLRWREEADAFISALSEELPSEFNAIRTGTIDQEDYDQMISRSCFIAPRLAKITSTYDEEFELQIVATPASSHAMAAGVSRQPSLRFLRKTRDPRDLRPHRELRASRTFKYNEVVLRPESLPSALLVAGHEAVPYGTRSGGALLARQIAEWSTSYRKDPERELLLASDFLEPGSQSRNPKPRVTRTRFQRGVW